MCARARKGITSKRVVCVWVCRCVSLHEKMIRSDATDFFFSLLFFLALWMKCCCWCWERKIIIFVKDIFPRDWWESRTYITLYMTSNFIERERERKRDRWIIPIRLNVNWKEKKNLREKSRINLRLKLETRKFSKNNRHAKTIFFLFLLKVLQQKLFKAPRVNSFGYSHHTSRSSITSKHETSAKALMYIQTSKTYRVILASIF